MCSSSQRAHRLSRSGPSTRPEPKASCKPRRRTRKRNAPSAIAVVDFAGDLLAFERMDGVRSASAELAIETGRTAERLQRPTRRHANLGIRSHNGFTITIPGFKLSAHTGHEARR
jgi:uncharacterized protein GlcG (DUF336 family)